MNSNTHDKIIQEAQDKISLNLKNAESARRDFIESTKSFVANWFKGEIERQVTSQPEVTKSLGKEQLSKLKTGLSEIIAKAPEYVASRLDLAEQWPLQRENENPTNSSKFYEIQSKAREVMDIEIRRLFGHAGKLLIDFGFAKPDKNGSWTGIPGSLPTYNYGISWDKPMELKWRQFDSASKNILSARRDLDVAKSAKSRAEAEDLWNAA